MQKLPRVWYSWVPTNLGRLNILFFGKSKNIDKKLQNININNKKFSAKNIDISFISDTHYFLSKWLNPLAKTIFPTIENELFGTVDVDIEETEKNFLGKIELFYPEYFQAKAFFDLAHTGKIRIYGLSIMPENEFLWKDFSDKEEFLDYLAQVIFIIIKVIVHGDNHHHQKIDTAIEVKRGKFDPYFILKTMVEHIKRVEHDIKNMDRCFGRLKAENTVEEMKGYRSYINTFRSLFINNADDSQEKPLYARDPSILDNIIDSTNATVQKWVKTPTYFSTILSILLVYVAISISGAILYINLMGNNYRAHPLITNDWTFYFFVLILLLVFMASHIRCSALSWLFYKYYPFYEYLYHLSAYEHPKRLHDKIFKFFVKYYKSLFFLFIAVLLYLVIKQ